MNITDLIDNWDDISDNRKSEAVDKAITFLLKDIKGNDDILYNLFSELDLFEQDDRFGTEGLVV